MPVTILYRTPVPSTADAVAGSRITIELGKEYDDGSLI